MQDLHLGLVRNLMAEKVERTDTAVFLKKRTLLLF